MPIAEDPELAAAKRLLDAAEEAGFAFARIAPGPDGPLHGTRHSLQWADEIYLGGFSGSCHALRRRRYSLLVPGGLPADARVSGDAIEVLHTVVTEWST